MNANIEGDFQIWISVPLIFVFKNHTIGYYVAILDRTLDLFY